MNSADFEWAIEWRMYEIKETNLSWWPLYN